MNAIDDLKSKLIQTFDRFDTVENNVKELQVAVKDAEGFARKRLITKTWRTISAAKNMMIPGIFNVLGVHLLICLQIFQNIVFTYLLIKKSWKTSWLHLQPELLSALHWSHFPHSTGQNLFFSSQAIVPRLWVYALSAWKPDKNKCLKTILFYWTL